MLIESTVPISVAWRIVGMLGTPTFFGIGRSIQVGTSRLPRALPSARHCLTNLCLLACTDEESRLRC